MAIRSWSSKNPSRIDPDEIERIATDSLDKVHRQQPRVNAITSYLERRLNQNGFGDDFEYTLHTKEA